MSHLTRALLCLVPGLMAAAASAQMDQAEMAFNFMFRAQIAEAAGTETLADDAALAQTFLDRLDQPKLAPELRHRLIEKAYAFGIKHPAGHEAAAEAIDLLEEREPKRADEWDERRLRIAELAFDAAPRNQREPDMLLDLYLAYGRDRLARRKVEAAMGFYERADAFAREHRRQRQDDVEAAMKEARRLQRVLGQIEQARAALKANPDDTAAAEALVKALGLELDSPAEAVAATDAIDDLELMQMLERAAATLKDLPEQDALQLARWYRQRAALPTEIGAGAKDTLLIRAKLYYSEYLFKHAKEDEDRLAAKFELRQVDDALSKLGVSPKVARKRVAKLAGGGRGQRDPKIEAAIDKGVAWLYEQMDPEDFWEKQPQHNQSRNYAGHTAIAVYALLMAEEDPRTQPALARAIRFLFGAQMQGTYAICFRMHTWELLPDRERYRSVMAADANWLRIAQTPEGFFDYTQHPKASPPRRDLSVTLAGALGFWLAEDVADLRIGPQSWERLGAAAIRGQQNDGGWSYKGIEGEVSYGSMTCAGLTSLLVAREHLPEHMHDAADKAIADGMEWLNYQYQPDRNPIKGGWYTYYLAAVQHVGLLTGTATFNNMDWYNAAADHLVKTQQADGSWGNVFETSFALAFLCRGGVNLTAAYESYGEAEQ
ncbi:MAG: hypothetical protein GVY24_06125 [Planctomycetes bacterium]|nr:hypothetical protein [Planctomycetota bacterium]